MTSQQAQPSIPRIHDTGTIARHERGTLFILMAIIGLLDCIMVVIVVYAVGYRTSYEVPLLKNETVMPIYWGPRG